MSRALDFRKYYLDHVHYLSTTWGGGRVGLLVIHLIETEKGRNASGKPLDR